MKATVTYPWLVLLSTVACLQNVYGFEYYDYTDDYDFGDTPLQVAVKKKDVDLVKSLLANGNDVKATNIKGQTALMIAAGEGSPTMIELLLPISDVKATDNYGGTALIYAARSANDKSVELLLPRSDVKATDNYGYTALMIAAFFGKEKSVELLLPRSDVKATNDYGKTALDIAKGFDQIVSLLQQQN